MLLRIVVTAANKAVNIGLLLFVVDFALLEVTVDAITVRTSSPADGLRTAVLAVDDVRKRETDQPDSVAGGHLSRRFLGGVLPMHDCWRRYGQALKGQAANCKIESFSALNEKSATDPSSDGALLTLSNRN